MKTIGLLHTVPNVFLTFEERLRAAMPDKELLIHHTLDTFLASDANLHGFTPNNLNRLAQLLQAKDREGADLLVVTCSTLTPWVKTLRSLLDTPVICIDDAMSRRAVELGSRILVMATAQSTVEPTMTNLREEADRVPKALELSSLVCGEAYAAVKKLDMETHDRLLKEQAASIRGQDVVVLAQASMAHLEEAIQDICGCTVLSSPSLCVRQVKETLYGS